jgi:hypothetical protein
VVSTRQRLACFGVAICGIQRLVHQVELQRRGVRRLDTRGRDRLQCLLPVPFDGADERQVGRQQRPTEQRQLGAAREVIRIVDRSQLELRVLAARRYPTRIALAEQQAIHRGLGRERRHVGSVCGSQRARAWRQGETSPTDHPGQVPVSGVCLGGNRLDNAEFISR